MAFWRAKGLLGGKGQFVDGRVVERRPRLGPWRLADLVRHPAGIHEFRQRNKAFSS